MCSSDLWRGSRPPADDPEHKLHEMSPTFNSSNRGKRDLTLDLGTADGMRLARQLFATADVVVENYTNGVMEKLGLDYASLAAENPGLILLRQPAFGATGPESDYRVFGNTIEGMSGITAMIGYSDDTYPLQMSNAFGDPVSGLNGTLAVLAALRAREADGRGRCIEAAQLEGFLPLMGQHLVEYQRTGEQRPRQANRRDGALFSGAFRCAGEDSWLAVEVRTDAERAALELATGVSLSGFATWARTMNRDGAATLLSSAGVPAAPVNCEPDVLGNEPFATAEFYVGYERPVTGFHLYPSLPVTLGGVRPAPATGAPTLGQHNREILEALGLHPSSIAALEARNVIGTVPV